MGFTTAELKIILPDNFRHSAQIRYEKKIDSVDDVNYVNTFIHI